MSKKKAAREGVMTTAAAVKEAVSIAYVQGMRPTPDAIDIIADQSGEELRSLGSSLQTQRKLVTERRAQVQHVVNELDAQIKVLDHALRLIEAN